MKTEKLKIIKTRNESIKFNFDSMRARGYKVGECLDTLEKIYGLQFDTIRSIVYKKNKEDLIERKIK